MMNPDNQDLYAALGESPQPTLEQIVAPDPVAQIQSAVGGLKTQDDLNRYFATSGFNADQFAAALPQYGTAVDYANAMQQGVSAYNNHPAPAAAPQPTPVVPTPTPTIQQAAKTAQMTPNGRAPMTREQFIAKYGTTFVADDKGGNAASEVAGQDVGAYYDNAMKEPQTYEQALAAGFGGDRRDWHPTSYGGGHDRATGAPITLDAWSYVDPHPESNHTNGWQEFGDFAGHALPIVALAFGAPYLAEGLGGVGAGSALAEDAAGNIIAGGAASASAGVGAAAGTGLNVAASMGITNPMLASAVNSGMINAGVQLGTTGKIDAGQLARSTLLSMGGQMAGNFTEAQITNALQSADADTAITNLLGPKGMDYVGMGANTLGRTLATGGSGKDAVTGFFATGAGAMLGDATKDYLGKGDYTKAIGDAVQGAASTAIRGGSVANSLKSAGSNFISSKVSEKLDGLMPSGVSIDPTVKKIATGTFIAALQGKPLTTGAINAAFAASADYINQSLGLTKAPKGKAPGTIPYNYDPANNPAAPNADENPDTNGTVAGYVADEEFNQWMTDAAMADRKEDPAGALTDAGLTDTTDELPLDQVIVTGNKPPEETTTTTTTTTTTPDTTGGDNTLPTVTIVGKGEQPTFDDTPLEQIPGTGVDINDIPVTPAPKPKPTTTAPAPVVTPKPATTTPVAPQYTGVDGSTTYGLPTELADILQMDLDERDILKYLQKAKALRAPKAHNPVYAAEGGSIDDLIEYLRR